MHRWWPCSAGWTRSLQSNRWGATAACLGSGSTSGAANSWEIVCQAAGWGLQKCVRGGFVIVLAGWLGMQQQLPCKWLLRYC